MKKNVILTSLLFGTMLVTLGAEHTKAAEVVGQGKQTSTTVNIKDNTDPVDPIDPIDPNQKMLSLEKVPTMYNFESKLQNKDYTLKSELKDNNTIEVFNDRISRDWSVKATVLNNAIKSTTKNFTVTSFLINDTEITATGKDGIVFASEKDKTAENNTGLVKKAITDVQIKFTDAENILKAGDKLDGKINYTLNNTSVAE